MKNNIKMILSALSIIKSYLNFIISKGKQNKAAVPAMFYQSFYSVKGTANQLAISGRAEKSDFFIDGTGNKVNITHTEISNTIITVSGNNNVVQCEDGVKLRNAVITIRGNACIIKIGRGTTFGGVRIINVGTDNEVSIGAGCLFADFIEIWGSDTHPIYNEKKEIINKEKPIIIKDRVWVGARAVILKGVTIESGSIVGMGSLVINNVPASSITAGNPNRIIKENINWALHY
jgi:acetyltransferase-like isoleucine patch superfamily enzyme